MLAQIYESVPTRTPLVSAYLRLTESRHARTTHTHTCMRVNKWVDPYTYAANIDTLTHASSTSDQRWWCFLNAFGTSGRNMGLISYKKSVNMGVKVHWLLTRFWSNIIKIPPITTWCARLDLTSELYMKTITLHIFERCQYLLWIGNEQLKGKNTQMVV